MQKLPRITNRTKLKRIKLSYICSMIENKNIIDTYLYYNNVDELYKYKEIIDQIEYNKIIDYETR